jgi:hypothetical protein
MQVVPGVHSMPLPAQKLPPEVVRKQKQPFSGLPHVFNRVLHGSEAFGQVRAWLQAAGPEWIPMLQDRLDGRWRPADDLAKVIQGHLPLALALMSLASLPASRSGLCAVVWPEPSGDSASEHPAS